MATLIAPTNHSPLEDAEAIRKAVKGWGTDEKVIITILGHRDAIQRQKIREAYYELFQEDLIKRLESELSGDFEKLSDEASDDFHKAVHVAIRCIQDHKKYYEKVLRNAMKGGGTNEDALTRVIVTRAEKDLNDIKEIYYKRNSVQLEDSVAKETSGDYKKFLLTLMGKED
ncbi:hypothetical protein HN51_033371 [Arachis hypogaea]|uniref:Annexin n=1 Tax=Arachis hypogaea TaxID=3818 RepID=A0A445B134_ARAHY|nr:annexin-like protein RJ4 [Arachis hypogaea]QHO17864.1 Annexin-like protein [Arachis hypogaea]RYR32397.1 hypothetical protein Ahy_A10g046972 [Arachis hypogaea]